MKQICKKYAALAVYIIGGIFLLITYTTFWVGVFMLYVAGLCVVLLLTFWRECDFSAVKGAFLATLIAIFSLTIGGAASIATQATFNDIQLKGQK